MKIKFRQSGGFAGLLSGCDLDTASMPPAEASQLESLVRESQILQLKSAGDTQARDQFNYQIAIETSEGSHQVLLDDSTLPARVEPLLDYLRKQAKPLPRKPIQ